MSTYDEYDPIRATGTFHNAPRFGKTDDFSVLFSDNPSDRKSYAVGLIVAGVIILCCFLAWLVAILVLKCMGPSRVGFLSGSPFTTAGRRPFRVRVTFVACAVVSIVFAILLVTQGVTQLKNTTQTVNNNNEEIQSLLTDADTIVVSIRTIGQSSRGVRDDLISNLGNFCPGEPNIEAQTGINFDQLALEAVDLLNQLDDFIASDIEDFQRNLDMAMDGSQNVEDIIDQIQMNDWQVLLILIPYIMLPALLIVGVMMTWHGVDLPHVKCVMKWVILPLFVIATIAAFAGSATTSFLAVTNADMCSGGAENTPDATVMNVLNTLQLDRDTTVYRAVEYYLSRCALDNPFEFISKYDDEVAMANATVHELSSALDTVSVASLSQICGRDFGPIAELVQTMEGNLIQLAQNTQGALSLLACERILPIYTGTFYDGTCNYSMSAVAWIFSAALVIAFLGMLMIMFRASLYDDNIGGDLIQAYDFPRKDQGSDGSVNRGSTFSSSPGNRSPAERSVAGYSDNDDMYYDESLASSPERY